ncbi:acyl-CoA/acyl-ACP dehydrogenase [Streptomyces caniferus]|uniref:acyl-CoA dehydrogenase family protein n=1 Tax=Streptomyces caniferus TaxID=285557 RepID=UPI002E2B889B|nr:acyl-CoA dehydrogenase family protein [Streptomyces caniferus]
MNERPLNPWYSDETPSFLEHLYRGELRWDLISRFPRQDPADREAGDRALTAFSDLLRERVDPVEVDATGVLPPELPEALAAGGFDRLQVPPSLGGLGLSALNTFRVVEAAAGWSMPTAQILSVQNTIGVGPFLPALPPGPLRDTVEARTRSGVFSGNGDTEPQGAANHKRFTTATPTEDGAAFLLNGEKVFTGNAPIAAMVNVTATVREGDSERVRLFFVDTDSPGFRVSAHHEFMGLKGFPSGALTFEDVRVPAHMMMVEGEHNRRLTPELYRRLVVGRVHTIGAPSLAFSRLCLEWARDFVNRRQIDERPLGSYDEIQRNVADTLSEVFALETLTQWCLLAEDQVPANPGFEQVAAKNLTSLTAWRVVERTMALYGAEGYETERSKARRGVPPVPLERAFREARGLRISGGVDFMMDIWMAHKAVFWCYYPLPANAEAIEAEPDLSCLDEADLTEANLDHLRFAVTGTKTFARTCLELARRYPDQDELFEQERLLIPLTQIGNELLLMSLVLGRTSSLGTSGPQSTQDLADVYCAEARLRIADAWRRHHAADSPAASRAAGQWLSGERWADLLPDMPGDASPAGK